MEYFEILAEDAHSVTVRTSHASNPHLRTLLVEGNGYFDAVSADGMLKHGEDDVLTLYWNHSRAHLLEALRNACARCAHYGS